MLRFHDNVFRWDDFYSFIELLMDFHLESHAHHLQMIIKYAVLSAVNSTWLMGSQNAFIVVVVEACKLSAAACRIWLPDQGLSPGPLD